MELPGDIVVRPLDVDRDLDDAYAVVRACELADVGWSDATRESVMAQASGPLAWREAQRVAHSGTSPVGLLLVELDRRGREVFLDAFAVGARPRLVQRALMESGLASARALAAAEPSMLGAGGADPYALSPQVWQVVAAAYEQDAGYREVLQDMGFRPIRRFWRMLLDLAGGSPEAPSPPSGATYRTVDGAADRRMLHELFTKSFANHFGSTHDRPFDEWITGVEALPGVDPSRWWIAELDGRPVGLCILDDSRAEFAEGYVRTLGVIPAARGRGIGRWLLGCAAADAVARGSTGLALAVDGENTTGATALYESVGFATRHVVDFWCYPLADSADSR